MFLSNCPHGALVGVGDRGDEDISFQDGARRHDREEGTEEEDEGVHERGRHRGSNSFECEAKGRRSCKIGDRISLGNAVRDQGLYICLRRWFGTLTLQAAARASDHFVAPRNTTSRLSSVSVLTAYGIVMSAQRRSSPWIIVRRAACRFWRRSSTVLAQMSVSADSLASKQCQDSYACIMSSDEIFCRFRKPESRYRGCLSTPTQRSPISKL